MSDSSNVLLPQKTFKTLEIHLNQLSSYRAIDPSKSLPTSQLKTREQDPDLNHFLNARQSAPSTDPKDNITAYLENYRTAAIDFAQKKTFSVVDLDQPPKRNIVECQSVNTE